MQTKYKKDDLLIEEINSVITHQEKILSQQIKILTDIKKNFKKTNECGYEITPHPNEILEKEQIKNSRKIRSQIKKIQKQKKKIISLSFKKNKLNSLLLKKISNDKIDEIKQVKIEKKYRLKINEISLKITNAVIDINSYSEMTIAYTNEKI